VPQTMVTVARDPALRWPLWHSDIEVAPGESSVGRATHGYCERTRVASPSIGFAAITMMGSVPAVAAILGVAASSIFRGTKGEISTHTSMVGSPLRSRGRARAGVTALNLPNEVTTRSEDRPRIDDGVDDRLALVALFGIACGIPLFSRWRSHERR
jgi:hypothetical protein